MRISPINNFNNYNRNVSFGMFAKEDSEYTEAAVRGGLASGYLDKEDQQDYFETIKDDENFIVYKDKETGKVRGRFSDEFVKNNANDRQITGIIAGLERRHNLDDLSVFKNTDWVVERLWDIKKVLQGVNLVEEQLKYQQIGEPINYGRSFEEILDGYAK